MDRSEIAETVSESIYGKSASISVILMNVKSPLRFISGSVLFWKNG